MAPRLYAFDPTSQLGFSVDVDDDVLTFHVHQDVTALLELNRRQYNDAPRRWGEWTHVARIPLAEAYLLQKAGLFNNSEELRKYLNSSDHRGFRTRPGTL